MEKVLYDVVIGGLVALLTLAVRWQLPFIRSLFDEESRRQSKQISGTWNAKEVFADGSEDNFIMDIHCRWGRVTGKHTCHSGYDEGKTYDIEGTYKDQILTFGWKPSNSVGLESGTVTARLVTDRRLEGHGLYVEPADGKIYTSIFKAEMKS
jgi:hypothetical protein